MPLAVFATSAIQLKAMLVYVDVAKGSEIVVLLSFSVQERQ